MFLVGWYLLQFLIVPNLQILSDKYEYPDLHSKQLKASAYL